MSGCTDLMALVVILAVLLLMAVVGLCIHIRVAVLGRRLLKVCANDWATAWVAVENVRAENETMAAAFRRGLRGPRK